MKRLKKADLQTLLSAIEELNSDFDPQTLPERTLSAASKVIEADSVSFTGIGYNGELSGLVGDNSETISAVEIEIFNQYMRENPSFAAYIVERRPETLKITDLIPPEQFERTGVFNEFYRRAGVRNQPVSPLLISKDLFVSCSINTSEPDFSERDKLLMSLLAPHLVNTIRNTLAYERLNSALDTQNCGIIAVTPSGEPQFFSEFARQLLETYFAGEKRAANSLPKTLRKWLKRENSLLKKKSFSLPSEPLNIKNAVGELTVRLIYNENTRERTLLLDEKKNLSSKMSERLNLTRRESEILFLIAQGKSDEVIARLCHISPRTVHKHVENIYTKLGVETRTAAMLRALEIF